jgi:hypothetical protein
VVLSGGLSTGANAVLADAWSWDGWRWVEAQISDPEGDGDPGQSLSGIAGYDGRSSATLVMDFPNGTNWLWNGQSWRAAAPEPGTPSPGGRFSGAMSYDSDRGRLVLFGGSELTDTWEWDGARWWDRTGAVTPPSRRYGGMIYDPLRKRTILFGGQNVAIPTDQYPLQTFAWDGQRWTDLGIPGPGGRASFGFVFDEARGEGVMFGGRTALPGTPGGLAVLRWTGTAYAWQAVTPTDPEGDGNPTPAEGTLAWDAAGQVSLWFAGNGQTWAWNGSSWARRSPGDPEGDGNPNVPPFSTLSHDATRSRTWVWPGDGLWSWDGASWTRRIPSTALPYALGATLVHEPRTGKLLIFGGRTVADLAFTWTINPETGVAAAATQPAPAPTWRYSPACTQDTGLATATCFGGTYSTPTGTTFTSPETWSHDGVAWRLVAATAPASLVATNLGGQSFAYHPGLGRLVLYSRGMVWTLQQQAAAGAFSGTWSEVAVLDPEADGSPGSDGVLVYDTRRRALVLFEYAQPQARTWIWNPATSGFRRLAIANPLGAGGPEHTALPVTFDPVAGRAVAMGSQPWVWDSGAEARPAHVLHVPFAAAGGPDPAACPEGATACPVREVRVRWTAGADGAGSAPALQAWRGAWTTLQTGAGTVASPQPMTWTSQGTISLQQVSTLFHGPERELTLALVPSGAGALQVDALRRVATAGVEVTVRYRRP